MLTTSVYLQRLHITLTPLPSHHPSPQSFPEIFNKASMMNIGFQEALASGNFSCVIFHDIDMIPESDYNFYTCSSQPRHVAAYCNKFQYRLACCVVLCSHVLVSDSILSLHPSGYDFILIFMHFIIAFSQV